LPLSEVYPGYKRRYAQEHGYRFEKQALLWETPRLRTPQQFERWTDVVAIVHDELQVARTLIALSIRSLSLRDQNTLWIKSN